MRKNFEVNLVGSWWDSARTTHMLDLQTANFECRASSQTGSDVILEIFYLDSQNPGLHANMYIQNWLRYSNKGKFDHWLLCYLDLEVTMIKASAEHPKLLPVLYFCSISKIVQSIAIIVNLNFDLVWPSPWGQTHDTNFKTSTGGRCTSKTNLRSKGPAVLG